MVVTVSEIDRLVVEVLRWASLNPKAFIMALHDPAVPSA